jgi:hypothetical protein
MGLTVLAKALLATLGFICWYQVRITIFVRAAIVQSHVCLMLMHLQRTTTKTS